VPDRQRPSLASWRKKGGGAATVDTWESSVWARAWGVAWRKRERMERKVASFTEKSFCVIMGKRSGEVEVGLKKGGVGGVSNTTIPRHVQSAFSTWCDERENKEII